MFGPECHLLEAQSDHPVLQRCAHRARLTLRVRVALGAAQILSPAQGETGLMLTSGRMRLAGMTRRQAGEFQREPIRRGGGGILLGAEKGAGGESVNAAGAPPRGAV